MEDSYPIRYVVQIDDSDTDAKVESIVNDFDTIGSAAQNAGEKIDNSLTQFSTDELKKGIEVAKGAFAELEQARQKALKDGDVATASGIKQKMEELAEVTLDMTRVVDGESESLRAATALSGMFASVMNAVREAESTTSEATSDATGAIRRLLNAIQETWKEAEKGESVFYKLVGGQEKFKEILDAMPPGMKMVVTEMTGMVKAARAFIATPLGVILAAIVLAFEGVNTWLQSDNEAFEKMNAIAGAVSGTLDGLKEVAVQLGKALYNLFTGNTEEAKNAFGSAMDAAENIKKVSSINSQLAREEAKLHRDRSEWQKEEARIDAEIAELRTKMYSGSEKERLDAINKAEGLITEKYKKRVDFADREFKIAKAKNELTTTSQSDLDKQNELEAAVLREESAMNRELTMFKRRESSTLNALNSANEKIVKSENDLAYKLERAVYNRQKQLTALENAVANARLDAMDEGHEKTMRKLEQHEKEELQKVESMKDQYLQQKITDAKAEFDARPENKGKSFDPKSINLTTKEVEMFDTYLKAVKEKAAKMRADMFDKERDDMNLYLAEYGNYQQQRLAISEQYAQKIAKAETEGERLILEQQRDAALNNVDEKFGKTTKAMADLFQDASQKSVLAVQKIIDKYEQLVQMMSTGELDSDALKSFGFSDADISKITKGDIKIKDLTDRIKELKGQLAERSPWQSFVKNMNEGIKKLSTKENGSLGEGISQITSSIKNFLPSIQEFGSSIANIFGVDDSAISDITNSLDGLMATGQGIGQMMSGDIVGGAMSAVNGISQVVDALDGLFGADYAQYNQMKQEYDSLSDVWDELIDKKREYIKESYGVEADKVGKEAISISNRKADAARQLAEELLGSGASVGSHSIGYRMNTKYFDSKDWDAAKQALGKGFNDVYQLLGKSGEELEKLKETAPAFWAKMDEDFRKYLQDIIDAEKTTKEIQDSIREQLTATTFDNMYSNFESTLLNMEADSKDFVNDLNASFNKALLSQTLGAQYKDKLKSWYDKFAAGMNKEAGLTEEEMNALRREYQGYVEEAIKQRDAIAAMTGYDTDSIKSQSSTVGTKVVADQNSVDELNGRFTAMQIAMESTVKEAVQMREAMNEVRDVSLMAIDHLESISKNTSHLAIISSRLEQIEKNTR